MNTLPEKGPDQNGGRPAAVRYWDRILDPQNLEREAVPQAEGVNRLTLTEEIEFADTPDMAAAREWLEGATPQPEWIMDLGAGLGAGSFAMARTGRRVLAVDASPARLCKLLERARAAGLEGRIGVVVAQAEALPFAAGSVPALYTKSVLIHTVLPRAAGEIARALAPGGRAALVEPQPHSPLVNLYRRLLAPAAWRSITRYFGAREQAIFLRAPGMRGARPPVLPFYFLSFFAFVFQFGWPAPRLFRWSLALLHGLDRLLLRLIPPLRRWAWFGVIRLEKWKRKDKTC